jgi:hypothetical protein
MKKVIILIVMLAVSISFIAASGDKEEAVVSTATDSASSASLDNASLAWEVSGEEIIFTFAANTTGWISVGFNPSRVMKDAQYVIGYVADGQTAVRDDFGTGTFAHGPDTDLGGTDDIRLISGREENGWTELVFALPIDSGDEYDVPLTIGETHKILIAYGPDGKDDFRTKHTFKTSFEATF